MKEANSTPHRSSKDDSYPEGIPNYKVLIFMFFVFILISSDFFVESVLSNVSRSFADGKNVKNVGIIVQAILLILATILVSYLVHSEII